MIRVNLPFVIRLVLRLTKFLVSIENLVEGMWILFLGFSLVYLRNVRAWLLQVPSVFAFVRFVLGNRFGKTVAD